jgi:hypothetical protein
VEATRRGEDLIVGDGGGRQKSTFEPVPAEGRVAPGTLHGFFLPEEVHLRAGGEKEATLNLRCMGRGGVQGRLFFQPPQGIRIEPQSVEIDKMTEGEEKTVRVRVKADADAAQTLHTVRMELETQPGRPRLASPMACTLPVSVGVVITEDKRIPTRGQSIVRAPGYTMRVDHYSGVSYSLLDADGHRRHGHLHNTNTCYGIPAVVAGEDQWAFRYRYPSQFIWDGKNTLTVGPGNGERLRLRYTFLEDRIVMALLPHPPADPNRQYTMWLGNFDILGEPRSLGTRKLGEQSADWFYFPHPVHRQGMLLGLPEKTALAGRGGRTAVSFPMKAKQEIVLRFADEAKLKELFRE